MVKKPILKVDKPHFVVKLYEDVLEVDLKEGAKRKLERVVEAHPVLRRSLGFMFQTIVPLDVALDAIDVVNVDEKGRLKISVLNRKDLIIPLKVDESRRFAEKLNELVPLAKAKKPGMIIF